MDRYYGFDLGDAESAVSCLNKNDAGVPRIITVGEAGSFVTAYARLRNGALVIGEAACYNPEAVERKIRFKSRFLRDPDSRRDVKSFAAGVWAARRAGTKQRESATEDCLRRRDIRPCALSPSREPLW